MYRKESVSRLRVDAGKERARTLSNFEGLSGNTATKLNKANREKTFEPISKGRVELWRHW